MGAADGLALGSVDGRGVGELDVLARVLGGDDLVSAPIVEGHRAVAAHSGHGPGLSVRDAEVGVVAARRDPVADRECLAAAGGHRRAASGEGIEVRALRADGRVEVGDLFAGVGHDEVAGRTEARERRCALDVGAVHDDLPACEEGVEHLVASVALAHPQAQDGVGLVGESAHGLEGHDRRRVRVGDSVVEDAASADGRELVAVPDERDPGAGFVCEGEERPGGVLVEHPGLVDHEQVPGSKGCGLAGSGVGLPGPVPVVVPAPPVLVDQPGGRVSLGAGLTRGDVGGLHRRGHHDQLPTVVRQVLSDRAQHRGLACSGGSLDDHEGRGARQRADRVVMDGLFLVRVEAVGTLQIGGVIGASGDPGDEVTLDGQDPWRGEGSDVFGDVASGQQRGAARDGPGSDVLRQLDPGGSVRDERRLGEQDLGLPANVSRGPGRPPGAEHRDDQVSGSVAVDPPRQRPPEGDGVGRVSVADLVELAVPSVGELATVLRHDLVGSCLRPRPPVPHLTHPRTRFLVGMPDSPVGLELVHVAADLRGPGTEGADVRRELADLARLGVDSQPVRSQHRPELRVGRDGGVTNPVDRLDAVPDADGVDTPPGAGRPDAGVDLQVEVAVRVARARRVVADDRGLDGLDGNLDLAPARADAGGRVRRDPADDLGGRLVLGSVQGGRDLRMQSGRQRPRLGAVDDHLDEAQRVVVGSDVALGRHRLYVDAGDPLLVHLAGHAAHASHAAGGGDQARRDAVAFGEVVVVRPRPVALDVGPRSSRCSAVELHPSVHPDHRLHDVRRQPTDP